MAFDDFLAGYCQLLTQARLLASRYDDIDHKSLADAAETVLALALDWLSNAQFDDDEPV